MGDVIKWNVAAEVFKPTGVKGEAEQDVREGGVNQMRLYLQSQLIVTHDKGLSDKEQGQEIKEKERMRQEQMQ